MDKTLIAKIKSELLSQADSIVPENMQLNPMLKMLMRGMSPGEFIVDYITKIPDEYFPAIVNLAQKVTEIANQ